MKENVISIKDCLYIKDALGWNLLAYKKINSMKELCIDAEIKTELDNSLNLLKKHYDSLITILEGNEN